MSAIEILHSHETGGEMVPTFLHLHIFGLLGSLNQVLVTNSEGNCFWTSGKMLALAFYVLSSSPSNATDSARSDDIFQETYFLTSKDRIIILLTRMIIVKFTILWRAGKLFGKWSVDINVRWYSKGISESDYHQ